jgi:putative oxidoreductase
MLRKVIAQLLASNASPAMLLVRVAVGFVFLTSGIVKFVFENQGEGRFLKLGFHAPEATAYFVGTVEIAAGALLMVGLLTRLAAIPLIVDMAVAIVTSKLPLLFGPGPEPVAAAPKVGLWAFAYVARLDLTMLLLVSFLLVVGAGAYSVDAWLLKRVTVEPHRSMGHGRPALAR